MLSVTANAGEMFAVRTSSQYGIQVDVVIHMQQILPKGVKMVLQLLRGIYQRSCQIHDLVGYAAHIHQVISLAITFLL